MLLLGARNFHAAPRIPLKEHASIICFYCSFPPPHRQAVRRRKRRCQNFTPSPGPRASFVKLAALFQRRSLEKPKVFAPFFSKSGHFLT
jgi:hypothetical protein